MTQNDLPLPRQFPMPKSGERDRFFGRTRTWWYEHAVPGPVNAFRPPIRSVTEVKPGNIKGRRFIVFASAVRFFEEMEAEQSQEERVTTVLAEK